MSDVEEEKAELETHWWNINVSIKTTSEHVDELMNGIEKVVCPEAESEGDAHECKYEWVLGARMMDTFKHYVKEAQVDCQWVKDEMKERNIENSEIEKLVDDAIESMDAVWELVKQLPDDS